jgi:hypothetical protein
MTYTCPKCGATITIETDDKAYAQKKIEAFKKRHRCKEKKL